MKVNIWERDKKSGIEDIEYTYGNYQPAKSTVIYSKLSKKRLRENKWVIQLLIAGAVLLVILGLFRANIPFAGPLKNTVRYLMTTETNLQPVLHKVVQLASQAGNLEWPLLDDVPRSAAPVISDVPPESLLLLPVSGDVIRTYGWTVDPAGKVQTFNEGIDIAVPTGTDVKASAAGRVIDVGEQTGQGMFILVENSSGELVRYAHLAEVKVNPLQQVKAGDIIAISGLPKDRQPYMHFEVIVNGRPVDPLSRLGIDFTRVNGAGKTDAR